MVFYPIRALNLTKLSTCLLLESGYNPAQFQQLFEIKSNQVSIIVWADFKLIQFYSCSACLDMRTQVICLGGFEFIWVFGSNYSRVFGWEDSVYGLFV